MSFFRSPSAPALVAALALIVPIHSGAADADSLVGFDGRVLETSHRRDVSLHPSWVEILDTHVFAASSPKGSGLAVYELDLPAKAAITSLDIKIGKRAARAVAIESSAAIASVPGASGLDPDHAVLREISSDGEQSRYQLVLYPVGKDEPLTARIRWVMLTAVSGSLVTARIPTRKGDAGLRGTELYVRAVSERGAALSDLRIDGAVAKRGEIPFDHDKAALVVQAHLDLPGASATRLRYHQTQLGGSLWALTVAVASPMPTAAPRAFSNVTVVIDISRSMGEAGVAAAASITREILARSGGALIDVVLFDRAARSVTGGPRRLDEKIEAAILAALAAAPLENGSDLRAALHTASAGLTAAASKAEAKGESSGRSRKSALIVISDGQAPRSGSAEALRLAIGESILEDVLVFAVDVATADSPLPSPAGGELAEVILETGGRTFSLPAASAHAEAASIAKQLGPAPQLGKLSVVVAGKALAGVSLPEHLGPGSSLTQTILWVGAKPAPAITLTGVRGGESESVTAKATNDPFRLPAAALALRLAHPASIAAAADGPGAITDDRGDPISATRALALAGDRVGVVNASLSLVVVNTTSRFARERLAFARRWGTELYRRSPTEDEANRLRLDPYVARAPAAKPSLKRLVRGGGLDRSTLGREIRNQLFKPVRHCYELALRGRSKLEGVARVRFEISRTEVIEATVDSPLPGKLRHCIEAAAYQLNVPAAAGDADTTYIVNYPFRLRPSKTGGTVDRGSDKIDEDDPLDGL